LTISAGLPATTHRGGTSERTTAAAPTTLSAPDRDTFENEGAQPDPHVSAEQDVTAYGQPRIANSISPWLGGEHGRYRRANERRELSHHRTAP
jgi:hypothetical protein